MWQVKIAQLLFETSTQSNPTSCSGRQDDALRDACLLFFMIICMVYFTPFYNLPLPCYTVKNHDSEHEMKMLCVHAFLQ
jgi:hypothetical protein